jgi:hypothetical protein
MECPSIDTDFPIVRVHRKGNNKYWQRRERNNKNDFSHLKFGVIANK